MARRVRERGEEPDRPWTREERRTLTMGVGAFGVDYIARNVKRTPASVYAKITEMFGGGGVGRGTMSVRQVSEDTGYTCRQINRAGRALGQRWQRTSTRGRVMLSDDQVEAITRWLAHDYWCRAAKTYACVGCARSDVQPKGLGLCTNCYASTRKRFRTLGLAFNRVSLLGMIDGVREKTAPEDRDWLDAFASSLRAGCVLTNGAIERLLERHLEDACSSDQR